MIDSVYLHFAYEKPYVQVLSAQNTRSLERTNRKLNSRRHILTLGISVGWKTFWSISLNDFFLLESSAILLRV